MEKEPSIFSNMSPVDWLLAAVFSGVVVFLAQSYFPPWGWLIGLVAALGLLYMAVFTALMDRLFRWVAPDAPEGAEFPAADALRHLFFGGLVLCSTLL